MPKPKPLKGLNIKFSPIQRRWLEKMSKLQGHYILAQVVKRLLDREMQAR